MILEFIQSPVTVRVGEVANWAFEITPWAASGASPVISVIRLDTGADVTASICPGTPTIVGTTYTIPPASGWLEGVEYRLTAQFSASGNTLRPFCKIQVVA